MEKRKLLFCVFFICFLFLTAASADVFERERLFEVNLKRAYDNYRNYDFYSANRDFSSAASYNETFFLNYLYFKNALRQNDIKKSHDILKRTVEKYSSEIPKAENILRSYENIYIRKQEEKTFKFSYVNSIHGAVRGPERFYNPTGIAVDAQNNIYVCSFATGRVHVFNSNGKYLKTIYKGESPYRIFVRDDKAYITDFNDGSLNIIDITTNRASKITDYNGKNLSGPQAVFVDEGGNIYLSLSGSRNVIKMSSDGNFLLEIKGFRMPADIKVDDGNIYVLDREDKKILLYDRFGNLIREITLKGASLPYSFEILTDGFIVSDISEGILNYDLRGNLLNRAVSVRGVNLNVIAPFYALKHKNNVYIADFNMNEIKIYRWGDLTEDKNKYMLDVVNLYENFFPVIATEFAVRSGPYSKETGINESNIIIFENDRRVFPVYVREYEEYFKNAALLVGVEKGIEDSKLNKVMLEILRENTFFDMLPLNDTEKNFYTYTQFIENKNSFIMEKRDYTLNFFDLLRQRKRKFLLFLVNDAKAFYAENKKLLELAEQNYVPVILIDFGKLTKVSNVNYFNFDAFKSSDFHNFLMDYRSGKYIAIYEASAAQRSGAWREIRYDIHFLGIEANDFFGYYTP